MCNNFVLTLDLSISQYFEQLIFSKKYLIKIFDNFFYLIIKTYR